MDKNKTSEKMKELHEKGLELHYKLAPIAKTIMDAHHSSETFSEHERLLIDAYLVTATTVLDLQRVVYDTQGLEDHIVCLDNEIDLLHGRLDDNL